MPYFHKILNDYFEDSEIDAYEKKLLTGISKVNITPYMEHIFSEVKDFTQYRGGLGYLFLESKVFELLSVYLSEVLELVFFHQAISVFLKVTGTRLPKQNGSSTASLLLHQVVRNWRKR